MPPSREKTYSKRARSIAGPPTGLTSTRTQTHRLEEDILDAKSIYNESKQKNIDSFMVSSHRNSARRSEPVSSSVTARKPLRQSVLALGSSPAFMSCKRCGLSYTRGAPEDETLHKVHCSRVRSGNEWTHEEEKEFMGHSSSISVDSHVQLTSGVHGRIIALRATIGGRIGTKLDTVMSTINAVLSSPPLTQAALDASKLYLFLTPTQNPQRQRIAGCVIAQNIDTALKVVRVSSGEQGVGGGLVHVDQGLYCDPLPMPTPVGISRILVAREYRRKGIAEALLNEVCRTFVHGCHLDPTKGQIAFSQPTGDGQKLMLKWGLGGVRIFEE